ncbi:MAG: hypothetical protein V4622_04205 [Bacteroidota bacterium]
METLTTQWSFREFKAYLFLYAANSKYFETQEEKNKIHSFVNNHTYRLIHREFENDNDFQSIQKILNYIKTEDLKQKDLDVLVQEIRELIDANHKPDVLEENMFLALKHLLHK